MMPVFPDRRDRHGHHPPVWRDTRPPGLDNPSAVLRGAAIGLAAGTLMWIAVITISTVAYRWWVG
jgi:hypothetical protein